ncbi:SDR family oxidoreductase [soil metagenome]
MAPVDFTDQYTLITGASSGIGAAFARKLAARGSNLILVARREDRLQTLADELRAAHGILVETVPLDLAEPAAGSGLAAELQFRGIEVTSVINNAGFATVGPFHTEDSEALQREIAVDVAAVVDISRAFIEPLRTAGVGVLVNVASAVAYQPFPNMAVYSASKAFVLHFTEALWQESLGTGLRVMAVSPGATRTEFFDVSGSAAPGAGVHTPEFVAEYALRALDSRRPPPSIAVGRLNSLATLMPRVVGRRALVQLSARLARSATQNSQ